MLRVGWPRSVAAADHERLADDIQEKKDEAVKEMVSTVLLITGRGLWAPISLVESSIVEFLTSKCIKGLAGLRSCIFCRSEIMRSPYDQVRASLHLWPWPPALISTQVVLQSLLTSEEQHGYRRCTLKTQVTGL